MEAINPLDLRRAFQGPGLASTYDGRPHARESVRVTHERHRGSACCSSSGPGPRRCAARRRQDVIGRHPVLIADRPHAVGHERICRSAPTHPDSRVSAWPSPAPITELRRSPEPKVQALNEGGANRPSTTTGSGANRNTNVCIPGFTASGFSTPSPAHTPSRSHTPHPHAASRRSPGHSTGHVQSACQRPRCRRRR